MPVEPGLDAFGGREIVSVVMSFISVDSCGFHACEGLAVEADFGEDLLRVLAALRRRARDGARACAPAAPAGPPGAARRAACEVTSFTMPRCLHLRLVEHLAHVVDAPAGDAASLNFSIQ